MKKTCRISGASSKTDYCMGTDFTYDDMGGRNVDEDTHTLLREEMRDGHQCWVVESVPVDTREIYSRKVSWDTSGLRRCRLCGVLRQAEQAAYRLLEPMVGGTSAAYGETR